MLPAPPVPYSSGSKKLEESVALSKVISLPVAAVKVIVPLDPGDEGVLPFPLPLPPPKTAYDGIPESPPDCPGACG